MNPKEVIIATLILLSMTLNFTYLYMSMAFLQQPHVSIFIILLGINLMVLLLFYQENKTQPDSNLFATAVGGNVLLWTATAFCIANTFIEQVSFSYKGVILALLFAAFLSNAILLIEYIKQKNTL